MFKTKKLQAELEKTESAFADVSNHALELQDELATLKLEHEKLTQLYQGFSCQHQEVLEAHNALKRELQEAKKQIGKYQKLVEDQKEHCRLHVETHEEDLRKIAQLQVTIATQLETIQQQNVTIDDLRKANDDAHDEVIKLRMQLKDEQERTTRAAARIAQLTVENEDLRATIDTQNETIMQQNYKLLELTNANEALQKKNDEVHDAYGDMVDALEKQAEERSTLIQRIENQVRTIGRLQKQIGTVPHADDAEEVTGE